MHYHFKIYFQGESTWKNMALTEIRQWTIYDLPSEIDLFHPKHCVELTWKDMDIHFITEWGLLVTRWLSDSSAYQPWQFIIMVSHRAVDQFTIIDCQDLYAELRINHLVTRRALPTIWKSWSVRKGAIGLCWTYDQLLFRVKVGAGVAYEKKGLMFKMEGVYGSRKMLFQLWYKWAGRMNLIWEQGAGKWKNLERSTNKWGRFKYKMHILVKNQWSE